MNIVAYYRVSTQKQGESGLGLEAQQAAVRSFARSGDEILEEFVEIESGKNDNRPVLAQAIAKAKALKAKLVIAKLDRLSRQASFVFALRDAGVEFIACDMPEANTLTIGIMAVIAQHEREAISSRTKAAAEARKVRTLARIAQDLGVDVDNDAVQVQYREECRKAAIECGLVDGVLPAARQASIASKKAAAEGCEAWQRAAGLARAMRSSGASLREIAEELNKSAFTTREGRPFQAMTVKRILARG